MAATETESPLPSLANTPLDAMVALMAKVRAKRDHIAMVDAKVARLEKHVTEEVRSRMYAQNTKTLKVVNVGSVTLVDTGRMKTSNPMEFIKWWKENKLQPLLDAGLEVDPAMSWFGKNADTEMIKMELEETGRLPNGVDQTTVTTLRFTPAKPTKEK